MFRYKGSMNANQGRVLLEFTITDSQTLTVGDSVKLASGKALLSAGNANVAGIVTGFVKANGAPLTDNGAGGKFVDTYTAPSSNTVKVIIDISKDSVYSCVADATLGTTTGSDLAGYTFDVVAGSDQLDESTALATTGQFVSLGVDADPLAPANSVLVKIYESQLV